MTTKLKKKPNKVGKKIKNKNDILFLDPIAF